MSGSLGIDWKEIFTLGSPLAEIVLRGTLVYLALFFMLRFGGKRTAGAIGISDLLVVVIIADAVQNAMASEHKTVLDGLLLAATILFWDYALDWLGYRSPRFQSLMNSLGYPAIVFLMLLENVFPSELVMPLAGFTATQNDFQIKPPALGDRQITTQRIKGVNTTHDR